MWKNKVCPAYNVIRKSYPEHHSGPVHACCYCSRKQEYCPIAIWVEFAPRILDPISPTVPLSLIYYSTPA